jgi:hypothetical protein
MNLAFSKRPSFTNTWTFLKLKNDGISKLAFSKQATIARQLYLFLKKPKIPKRSDNYVLTSHFKNTNWWINNNFSDKYFKKDRWHHCSFVFTGVAMREWILSEDKEIAEDDQVAYEQSQVRVLKREK